MHILVTEGYNNREEKFLIFEKDGALQAHSLNGYASEASGESLEGIVREIEAIEEVTRKSLEERTSPLYVYKFFPEYDHNRIYASYILNSRLSDGELSATIALVEYDNGGEMVLYSEQIFGE